MERLLSFFTRIEIDEIKRMCKEDIREAKKLMAFEVTKLVHGEAEAIKVKEASEALFSGFETDNMPTVLIEPFEEMLVTELLVKAQIVPSKSEAKRLIEGNGLSINKEKVTNVAKIISKYNFNDNGEILIQKGKKTFVKVKINSF